MVRDWIIFSKREDIELDTTKLLIVTLSGLLVATIFRVWTNLTLFNLEYDPNDTFSSNQELSTLVDGLMIFTFYVLLGTLYSLAYPDDTKRQQLITDIYYAVQISILRDILYLGTIAIASLGSENYPNRILYGDLDFALNFTFVLLTAIFFMGKILQRLKESFDDLNSAILVSFLISLLIMIVIIRTILKISINVVIYIL